MSEHVPDPEADDECDPCPECVREAWHDGHRDGLIVAFRTVDRALGRNGEYVLALRIRAVMRDALCDAGVLTSRSEPSAAPLTPEQPPADHGDGSGAGGREGGEGA